MKLIVTPVYLVAYSSTNLASTISMKYLLTKVSKSYAASLRQ